MSCARTAQPAPDHEVSRIVDAWCKLDHDHAFVPADHDVIEATRPLRILVVESMLREPGSTGRDLLHAFGSLGRITEELGGTLAATIVDGLLMAMSSPVAGLSEAGRAGWIALASGGRAAIAESYVRASKAASHEEALRGWEYPACVVPVDDELVAIAAGLPDDDDEALTSWASRVARSVTALGVRRAVVSGSEKAVLALEEALELAGVESVERHARAIPIAPANRQR